MALERKDVDKKYKWDLSVIYKDEAAFFEDYAKAEKMIKAFSAHEKTIISSAEGLYFCVRDENRCYPTAKITSNGRMNYC